MSTGMISGRVGDALAADLDRLAGKIGRPPEWIVTQAVERYVTAELALLDSLDEAEAQIDRGEFYTQDQMFDMLKTRYRTDRAA